MDNDRRATLDACPFIDDADPNCDQHFTLNQLSAAFSRCIDGYRGCPNYWRLVHHQPQRLIAITAHGRPLQPTGT